MKFLFFFFLFIAVVVSINNGQNLNADSAKYILENAQADTTDIKHLLKFSNEIAFLNSDTSLLLDEVALKLSREIHYSKGETEALNSIGEDFHFLGNYPDAIKMQFEALQLNRQRKDAAGEAQTLGMMGILYNNIGEYRTALQYLLPADTIYQKLPGRFEGSFVLANIADAYDLLKMKDSAFYYDREAYRKFAEPERQHAWSFVLRHMGNMYAELGKNDSAIKFYNAAIVNSNKSNDNINLSMAQESIADIYKFVRQYDSSLYYARNSYSNAKSVPIRVQMLESSTLLTSLYNMVNKKDSAYLFLNIASALKDSIYGPEKFRQLQVLMLNEQQSQQTLVHQEEEFRNKIKYIALLTALGIFLLIAFLLLRNNRHKQRANLLLEVQKQKVENTLSELKSTQAQLIQSEKMASLGELTAGIAHEIQNPLNFVNNFSEVSNELIDEMNIDLDKGDIAEAKEIASDLKQNLGKINHHGKRAGDIVKGMLEHSRPSTGVKEPTDINALADEYLRLSYHGLRAKDKAFNAKMETHFDESIGKINIIPQDIGRVLLNLFNNAFYAVKERQKAEGKEYEPTVSVTTKKSESHVIIAVSDNGNGVPQKIVDKIFQPFFTTKPTGQGTGLGLSLSYDIVKAHGGEIKVETKEGEARPDDPVARGSKFIIQLLLN